jgi:hypothetical protein
MLPLLLLLLRHIQVHHHDMLIQDSVSGLQQ